MNMNFENLFFTSIVVNDGIKGERKYFIDEYWVKKVKFKGEEKERYKFLNDDSRIRKLYEEKMKEFDLDESWIRLMDVESLKKVEKVKRKFKIVGNKLIEIVKKSERKEENFKPFIGLKSKIKCESEIVDFVEGKVKKRKIKLDSIENQGNVVKYEIVKNDKVVKFVSKDVDLKEVNGNDKNIVNVNNKDDREGLELDGCKVGVVGSRGFSDEKLLFDELDKIDNIFEIVSGGAKGADSYAVKYADDKKIRKLVLTPEWEKYGKSAGPIRNTLIVEKSDFLFIFWDGKSKGTEDVIKKCDRDGKFYKLIKYLAA